MTTTRLLIISLLFIGFATVFGWYLSLSRLKQAKIESKPKTAIVTTIYPIFDLVRNIAGVDKNVVLLLPPGTAPETYAPSATDADTIQSARIVFAVGNTTDNWIKDLVEKNGNPTLIRLNTTVNRAEPYVWLSLINAQQFADVIAQALAEDDPPGAATYLERAEAYKKELAQVRLYGQELKQNSSITMVADSSGKWGGLLGEMGIEVGDSSRTTSSLDMFGGSIATDTYINLIKYNLQTIFAN